MVNTDQQVKRMAELLKSGATMLFEHCPKCNAPLFKVNNEVWCSSCNKQVIVVKEGEKVEKLTAPFLLGEIEKTILTKIQESNQKIMNENDPTKLQELGDLLSTWLKILKNLRNLESRKKVI